MDKVVENEIRKLFKVTIENEKFMKLFPLYKFRNSSNKNYLTDALKGKITENIYNFMTFSRAGINRIFMLRSNEEKKSSETFFNEVFDASRYLHIYRLYEKVIYRKNDIRNFTAKDSEKLATKSSFADPFIMRHFHYKSEHYKSPQEEIYFFREDVPFISDISEDYQTLTNVNFESLLGLDTLFSKYKINDWHESLKEEEIPDMNIIYREAPSALFLVADFLYYNENFGQIYLNTREFEPLSNGIFSISDTFFPISTIKSIIEMNEIIELLDLSKFNEKFLIIIKYYYYGINENSNVKDLLDNLRNLKNLGTLNIDRKFMDNILDTDNAIEKYLKDFEKDALLTIDRTVSNDYSNNPEEMKKCTLENLKIINKTLECIYNYIGKGKNEKFSKRFLTSLFGRDYTNILTNLDDLEYQLFNRSNELGEDFKVTVLKEEDCFKKYLDEIKNKNLFIKNKNIDFRKLKESSFDLINYAKSLDYHFLLDPSINNIEYIASLAKLKNDIDGEEIEKLYQGFLNNLSKEIKRTFEKRENNEFLIKLNFNNNILLNLKSEKVGFRNSIKLKDFVIFDFNELTLNEILALIAISCEYFTVKFIAKNNFRLDANAKVEDYGFNSVDLFKDLLDLFKDFFLINNFEKIEMLIKVLTKIAEFMTTEKDHVIKSFKEQVVCINENNDGFDIKTFHNFIRGNRDNFSEEFFRDFKKFEFNYLISKVFK